MRCEECQPLVERYFDGELGEPATSLVAGHLAICASCAAAYRRLEREQDFYLRYESDVEISPAFWSGVFAKVAQEQAARSAWNFHSLWERFTRALGQFRAIRVSPLATAAIALLAICATAGIMKYIDSRERVSERAANSRTSQGGVTPLSAQGRAEDLTGNQGEPRVANRTGRGSNRLSGAGGSGAKQHDQKPAAARRR